jgi:hypothetical protein
MSQTAILKCLHFIQFNVELSSAMKIYLRHNLLSFRVDDLNLFVYISESLLNSKCCNMHIHNTWTVVKGKQVVLLCHCCPESPPSATQDFQDATRKRNLTPRYRLYEEILYARSRFHQPLDHFRHSGFQSVSGGAEFDMPHIYLIVILACSRH